MMSNILLLATTDLRLFLRDRGAFVWLVVIPLVFIAGMGMIPYGGGDNPMNFNARVVIENQDADFLGRIFEERLRNQGLWVAKADEADRAKFTLRIPADFTARVQERKQVDLAIVPLGERDENAEQVIKLKAARAVVELNALLIQHAITSRSPEPADEAALRAMLVQPEAVAVEAKFAGRRPIPSGFNQSLPGTLVMYLMMNLLIFGGSRVAEERQLGVLRRIAIHPVTSGQLVAGRIGGLLLLSLVPIGVLLAVGQVAFGVNLLPQLHWIVLTLLLLAWVAASLGVLLGFVVKAHEKIVGLSLLIALPAAALGGCWWPMEIVPAWAKPVCYSFPTAWAMDALHQFITFGGGFANAATALGVVALFGVVANLAAMKFFRV
jgi:ABC-2 type transport system permease protein